MDEDGSIAVTRKRNNWIACLVVALMLFFAFQTPHAQAFSQIDNSTMGEPAPLKPPVIEASQAVKFISRCQGALKIPKPETDTPNKYPPALVPVEEKLAVYRVTSSASIGGKTGHISHYLAHTVFPRAPPAFPA